MEEIIKNNNNFSSFTDEEIIAQIQQEDNEVLTEYIIQKYKKIVNMKVSKYFIVGAEHDDIVQEGLIGLYKAIKDFDNTKQNSFNTFANMCVERQLITAIKSSTRQKHIPLNSYISLNNSAYDDEDDVTLIDIFNNNSTQDPLDMITKEESYKYIEKNIQDTLSDFEKQVLSCYIKGESYAKISKTLNSPVKSIDNAIQRIRKKATKNIKFK